MSSSKPQSKILSDDNDAVEIQEYADRFGESGTTIRKSMAESNPFLQSVANLQAVLVCELALGVISPVLVLLSKDVVSMVAATTIFKFILCVMARELIARMREQEIHLVIRARGYTPNATPRSLGMFVLVCVYAMFLSLLVYSYAVLLSGSVSPGGEVAASFVLFTLALGAYILLIRHKRSYMIDDS